MTEKQRCVEHSKNKNNTASLPLVILVNQIFDIAHTLRCSWTICCYDMATLERCQTDSNSLQKVVVAAYEKKWSVLKQVLAQLQLRACLKGALELLF